MSWHIVVEKSSLFIYFYSVKIKFIYEICLFLVCLIFIHNFPKDTYYINRYSSCISSRVGNNRVVFCSPLNNFPCNRQHGQGLLDNLVSSTETGKKIIELERKILFFTLNILQQLVASLQRERERKHFFPKYFFRFLIYQYCKSKMCVKIVTWSKYSSDSYVT